MMPILVAFIGAGIALIGYTNAQIQALYNEAIITRQVAALLTEKMLYMISMIILVIGTLLFFYMQYLIKQIEMPLRGLTKELKEVDQKKLTHHLRQYDMEEINSIAIAMDSMRERYYRTIRMLEYQKVKAESVLAYLEEGIFILDEDGYIVDQNHYITSTIHQGDTQGKCHIQNVLRDAGCQGMLQKVFEEGHTATEASCEMVKNDRLYHVRIGRIGDETLHHGYLVILTDITKTRQLEAIRYQFVTNVTHELKTPLTSIQGFVETLQNGAIENKDVAKRFLDIIDIEAKRLYRLIQDILLLSEIENMEGICNQDVWLQQPVKEAMDLLQTDALKKAISLKLCVESDILLEKVSYDHVKQVMVNLIGNAIKYTDQGEVNICLFREKGQACLTVTDTGIGIPEEIGRAHV